MLLGEMWRVGIGGKPDALHWKVGCVCVCVCL